MDSIAEDFGIIMLLYLLLLVQLETIDGSFISLQDEINPLVQSELEQMNPYQNKNSFIGLFVTQKSALNLEVFLQRKRQNLNCFSMTR